MKIPLTYKRVFDSIGRHATKVLRIDNGTYGLKYILIGRFQIFFHKILTVILHKSLLTNKYDLKEVEYSSKCSKISFKQSV